jgi:type II secretory pathway pseudopilin PulG
LNRATGFTRGLSLVETVIALFVLLSAFAIVMTLFLRSNRALVQIEEKAIAVNFAETVLDDIKVWARDPAQFATGWGTWSNVQLTQFPGYEARVTVVTPVVFTPCTQLEIGKPVAEQREFQSTFRDLEILIEHRGQEVFRLNTRVAEPDRVADHIDVVLSSGASSLSAWDKATYEARLIDDDGNAIEDVSFHWVVTPDALGNGTVSGLITNYAQGEVTNVYRGFDGVDRHVTGPCRVQAVARYRGLEYLGQSELVEMLP